MKKIVLLSSNVFIKFNRIFSIIAVLSCLFLVNNTFAQSNIALTITNTPDIIALEGQEYLFKPIVSGSNSDTILNYSIVNKPIWSTFNTVTGVLTGTPASTHVGTITENISIGISDGVRSSALTAFSITVNDINHVDNNQPSIAIENIGVRHFIPNIPSSHRKVGTNVNVAPTITETPIITVNPTTITLEVGSTAPNFLDGVLVNDGTGNSFIAPWSGRHMQQVVSHNNTLWLLGGDDSTQKNDVWKSTNGTTWTQVDANGPDKAGKNAPWSGRYGHQVVSFDNALWLLGGHDDSRKNDIWKSTDGTTWTEVMTTGTKWSARESHQVVSFSDTLWLLGGYDGTHKNDIWKSIDGITWTQVDANGIGLNAPWSGRYIHQVISFNSALWLLGGWDGSNNKNDIWKSPDGITWTQVDANGDDSGKNAPWSDRGDHQVLSFNNALWLFGGFSGSYRNDVWKSIDGVTWTQVDSNGSGLNAPWSGRDSHQVVSFNNAIWLFGGHSSGNGNYKNDIWKSLDGSIWIGGEDVYIITTSGTVDVNTVGTYPITYSSTDIEGNAAVDKTRTYIVQNSNQDNPNPGTNNQAPIAITKFINTDFIGCVIKPSDTIIGYTNPIKAGKLVTLDGSDSSDPEGDALTYRWEQLGGSGVNLSNPNSVNPTFTTEALSSSDVTTGKTLFHQVVFQLTVTDANGGVSALVPQMNKSLISLTILPSDLNFDCPTITGTPETTVEEGTAYSFTPEGGDVDGGDTLAYTITNKPTWATFDLATGALTGTPTNANIGITTGIVISVIDGIATSSLNAFDLEVINSDTYTNNPDNSDELALTISNIFVDTANGNPNGVKAGLCIEFEENIIGLKDSGRISPSGIGTAGFDVSITESGVTSSGTLTRVSGCSAFTVNPQGISITPRLNTLFLELSKPINETTISSITLSYTKSLASGSFVERTNNNRVLKDFSRIITFDSEPINTNNAPTITGTPSTTIAEDSAYSFTPEGGDVDEDTTLGYSITNKPDWATFDLATGALTGTPTNANIGTTTGIIISVTDGTATASLSAFDLEVTNTNDAPTITGTPATTIAEDSVYSFTPGGGDIDAGDNPIYILENNPTWLSVNSTTGALSGTPTNSDVGSTQGIILKITSGGQSATLTFNIEVINTSDTPTITGTPPTTIAEDSVYSFTPGGGDIDAGDNPIYTLENNPTWLLVDSESGKLSGTPTNSDVGSTQGIILKITSGGQSATLTFNIEVTNTSDAPTITGTPPTTIAEDSPYSFTPGGGDIDAGDTTVYTLENNPTWLSVDSESGKLSGTPTNSDVVSTQGIILKITSGGQSATLTFNIEVINTSDAPTITGTPPTTIAEDTAYSFTPGGGDIDAGDTTVYTLENNPTWLSVNSTTGALSGTPTNADVGSTQGIILKITSGGQSATLTFNIEVTNINDDPTITGTPPTTIAENSVYSFTPEGGDIDAGDATVYTLENNPTWLSVNSTTGALSGTPTNADVGSTQGIILKITSGGQSATLTFNIEVTNINDAPTITGTPATTVEEDSAYSFTPVGGDIDAGDTPVYTLENNPTWLLVDSESGKLSGTPTNSDVGSTQGIILKITSGGQSATLTFNIEVTNINDAPTIAGTPATTVNQDVEYRFEPAGNDVDGDALTYSITNKPDWSTFDTATGVLTGIPTNANIGTTTGIVISVTDGTASTSLGAFDLEVINTNDAPTITGTSATTVNQDVEYRFEPAGNDVDGDTLTYSITNKPTWATLDPTTGVLTGTPTNDNIGTTTGIVISVTDGIASASLSAFDLEVTNTNDTPTIAGTPATTVNQDVEYRFEPAGNDVDGDTLTYSITNKPTWATLDPTTGALTGTPTSDNIGTTTGIVISVTDGTAIASLSAFDLEVINSDTDTDNPDNSDELALTIASLSVDTANGNPNGPKDGLCIEFEEDIIGLEDNLRVSPSHIGIHGFAVSITESGVTSSGKLTRVSGCSTYSLDPPSSSSSITPRLNTLFLELSKPIDETTTSITLSYTKSLASGSFVERTNNNRVLKDFSRPITFDVEVTNSNPDTPDSNTPNPDTDNPETNNPDNSDELALTIASLSVDTANGNPNGPKDGLCIEFEEDIIGLEDNLRVSPSHIGIHGFAVSITESGVTSSGKLTRVSGCSTYSLDPPSSSSSITTRLNTLFLELSKPIDETTTSITLSYIKSSDSGSFVERTNNNRVLKDFSHTITFDVEVTNSNPDTPDSNTPDPDTDNPDTDNPETNNPDNSDELALTIASLSVDTANGNPNGPKDGLCIEFEEDIIGLEDNLRVSPSHIGIHGFAVSITESGVTSSGKLTRVSGCSTYSLDPPSSSSSITPRLNTLFLELSKLIDETTTSITLSYIKSLDSGSFVERTNNNRVLKDFSHTITFDVEVTNSNPDIPDSNTPDPDTDNPEINNPDNSNPDTDNPDNSDSNTPDPDTDSSDNSDELALTIASLSVDTANGNPNGPKDGLCIEFEEDIIGLEDNLRVSSSSIGVDGFAVSITESGVTSSGKLTRVSGCSTYSLDPPSISSSINLRLNTLFLELSKPIDETTTGITLSYIKSSDSGSFVERTNNNRVLKDFSNTITFDVEVTNSNPDTPDPDTDNPDTPDSNTPDPDNSNPNTDSPDNSDELVLTIASVSVDTANGNPNGPKDGLCIEFEEDIIGLKNNLRVSSSSIGVDGFAVSITESEVTSSGTLTRVSGCSTYSLGHPSSSSSITPRLNTLFLELSKPIDETTTSITLSYIKSLDSGSFVERTNNNRVLKDFSNTITFDL